MAFFVLSTPRCPHNLHYAAGNRRCQGLLMNGPSYGNGPWPWHSRALAWMSSIGVDHRPSPTRAQEHQLERSSNNKIQTEPSILVLPHGSFYQACPRRDAQALCRAQRVDRAHARTIRGHFGRHRARAFRRPLSAVPAGPLHPALRTVAAAVPVLVPVPAPLPRQILCSPGVAGGGGGTGGPIWQSRMDEGCAAVEDIAVYRGHDDCLHNDGQPLLGGETISFEYANTFPSELSVRVATCIDPTMPTTFRPASISIQAQVVFDKMPRRYNTSVYPPHSNGVAAFGPVSVIQEAPESIQSCFSPPSCRSWDAVPHKQPWPPPEQFGTQGNGVQLRPTPWPSFIGNTVQVADLIKWLCYNSECTVAGPLFRLHLIIARRVRMLVMNWDCIWFKVHWRLPACVCGTLTEPSLPHKYFKWKIIERVVQCGQHCHELLKPAGQVDKFNKELLTCILVLSPPWTWTPQCLPSVRRLISGGGDLGAVTRKLFYSYQTKVVAGQGFKPWNEISVHVTMMTTLKPVDQSSEHVPRLLRATELIIVKLIDGTPVRIWELVDRSSGHGIPWVLFLAIASVYGYRNLQCILALFSLYWPVTFEKEVGLGCLIWNIHMSRVVECLYHDLFGTPLFISMKAKDYNRKNMHSPAAEALITKLLKDASAKCLVSSSQMMKGFYRVAKSLAAIILAIPSAKLAKSEPTVTHVVAPHALPKDTGRQL
ncbi:unnamed protein product [Miscanthus lutarioriparius]|uniref:Uncharacterized protein n=1 Tax=Miscanthus lutarioriparius TaxID=422564 RepID=A0A811R4H5_9POAL|nr:unnamed protein product [Miscanthus lutarioriparius]